MLGAQHGCHRGSACAETPASKVESFGNQGQLWDAEQKGPGVGQPLSMGLHSHSIPQRRPVKVCLVTYHLLTR